MDDALFVTYTEFQIGRSERIAVNARVIAPFVVNHRAELLNNVARDSVVRVTV